MNLHSVFVPPAQKILGALANWLDKAEAHAKAKGFEFEGLATARLAPDQYALLRQVQAACDAAKIPPARVLGIDPPKHPDTETKLDEMRPRIAAVREYLGAFNPEKFEGLEGKVLTLQAFGGKKAVALDYIVGFAVPNLYFHATTAYAILRHNGVDLGKMDFIAPVNFAE